MPIIDKDRRLKRIKSEARNKGIICISDILISSKSKLEWECKKGHRWSATYSNAFRHAKPCAQCRGRRNYTIDLCKKISKNRSGKFLSKKFTGGAVKHLWQCKNRHQWEATPFSVISSNKWCRKCSYIQTSDKLRFNIDIARSVAKQNEGECLSHKYINSSQKLKWRCKERHIFYTPLDPIKNRKVWCPYCVGKNITIDDMKRLANERGGRCLSKVYINSETPLNWECSNGHRWKAISNGMKNGKWCPECASGVGESICRLYFEKVFRAKFPRSRPEWLIGPTGRLLELDGYNDELKIAFEHQGQFHYRRNSYFYEEISSFKKRKNYDDLKEKICKRNGVKLIIIPDVLYILGIKNIPSFLKITFKKLKISVNDIENVKININTAYSSDVLKDLRLIAKRKGGVCLETTYINMHSKMRWKCNKCKYIWQAVPMSIKKGSWCPKCAGHIVTIETLVRHANKKNGKLVSNLYQRNSEKLEWRCKQGHSFMASWSSVKPNSEGRGGSWCPICYGSQKKTIDEMQKLAKKFNGRCLSKSYNGMHKLIKWECSEGHIFQKRPADVWHKESWCQICSNVRRAKRKIKYSINDLKRFAQLKKGVCQGEEYIGYHMPYKWNCEMNHSWEATWANIKKGRWCPICAKATRVLTRKKSS